MRFFTSVFLSKAPTWSPESYPKFVLNIKSSSPRYSNYLSLCIDSVNAELIFCFKPHKNWWYWTHLNFSWLIFLNPVLLKAPKLVMYACFGLIHLPHTKLTRSKTPRNWVNTEWDSTSRESTQSETPRQLSQCGVRLHVNWVKAKWDSTSTESTQKAPTFMKI